MSQQRHDEELKKSINSMSLEELKAKSLYILNFYSKTYPISFGKKLNKSKEYQLIIDRIRFLKKNI